MEEPKFVNTDTYAILQGVISDFQKITGKTVYEGQPEYSLCVLIAYQMSLTNSRINEAGKSQLLEFSKAPVIDNLASLLGVERLEANKASCTLRFNIIDGHLQVLLPLGSRVASSDGSVIFETVDDVVIPVGQNVIDVTAQCQTTGKIGNDYAIGNINVIQDPYAFIQSVSNIDITKGGSDEESDEDLRIRVKLAPSVFSVAGSKNAYIYWAKSASALIKDVAIITINDFMPIANPKPWTSVGTYNKGDVVEHNGVVSVNILGYGSSSIEPINMPKHWVSTGCVNIYALLENGEVTTESMNDIILSKLSSENVRPLTDIVRVQSATRVSYTIKIDVVKTKEQNPTLNNRIYTAVSNFIKNNTIKLGTNIVPSRIESVCFFDGVYDVKVTLSDDEGRKIVGNLEIEKNEVSRLEGITINITDSNE